MNVDKCEFQTWHDVNGSGLESSQTSSQKDPKPRQCDPATQDSATIPVFSFTVKQEQGRVPNEMLDNSLGLLHEIPNITVQPGPWHQQHNGAYSHGSCPICQEGQKILKQAQDALVAVQALVSSLRSSSLPPPPLLLSYPGHENQRDLRNLDYGCTIFSPDNIRKLWSNLSTTIEVKTIAAEQKIDGALERLELKTNLHRKLYRGDIIELVHPNIPRTHDAFKFIISNTQDMDEYCALVRIVGYHVSGLRVEPHHTVFGTRILIISRIYCDVVFPPALNKFALSVASATDHPCIYASATGMYNPFQLVQ